MILTILIFLVILTVLVLIHEAGHFFTAKFFGIKVEEFGFGLPPRAFGIKRGETIYSINWLPIGGFVKLYGEDEAGSGTVNLNPKTEKLKDEDRAFYAKPAWQRSLVIFAGVFMNFVLAVALVSFLFSAVGVPVPGNKVVVDTVVKGAPAGTAGLKQGDTIESINNISVTSPDQLVSYTRQRLGEKIIIKVETGNRQIKTVTLTPRKNYPANEGPMGVAISQSFSVKKYPWYQAPFEGTKEIISESFLILGGLASIVVQIFTKASVPSDVAGPIGIAQLTGTVVGIGPAAVLSFVSLLSLNLAIINILPIPALDGGRLFFIIFEAVTKKKVDPKFEAMAHTIGMAILLALIALITLNDVLRIISGQPIIPQQK
jgi:regulator of sigma E protease